LFLLPPPPSIRKDYYRGMSEEEKQKWLEDIAAQREEQAARSLQEKLYVGRRAAPPSPPSPSSALCPLQCLAPCSRLCFNAPGRGEAPCGRVAPLLAFFLGGCARDGPTLGCMCVTCVRLRVWGLQ
jgi:hypothetical protein